jgi:hypothetical protein
MSDDLLRETITRMDEIGQQGFDEITETVIVTLESIRQCKDLTSALKIAVDGLQKITDTAEGSSGLIAINALAAGCSFIEEHLQQQKRTIH